MNAFLAFTTKVALWFFWGQRKTDVKPGKAESNLFHYLFEVHQVGEQFT